MKGKISDTNNKIDNTVDILSDTRFSFIGAISHGRQIGHVDLVYFGATIDTVSVKMI